MTEPALFEHRRPWARMAGAAAALAALACVWLTPLPAALPGAFSAHMATHMTVVVLAAPLLALAVAGTRLDPLRRLPAPQLAVPVSLVELAVVWGWHAPALHHFARHNTSGFVAEQTMFLASALLLWLCVLAPEPTAALQGQDRAASRLEPGSTSAAGVLALLLTSMHMTLLGALLALAPRPLYHVGTSGALADQHLGGALMLFFGGIVYLGGGLGVAAALLKPRAPLARHSRVEEVRP